MDIHTVQGLTEVIQRVSSTSVLVLRMHVLGDILSQRQEVLIVAECVGCTERDLLFHRPVGLHSVIGACAQ